MDHEDLIALTANIVAAHVSNNAVAVGDVPQLVETVHGALAGLGQASEEPEPREPAVPVRTSIKPGHLVCLVCGAKQKMLKRHLRTAHNMSPDDYRKAFSLKPDYPMVSANYAKLRRTLANKIGLGRKPKASAAKPASKRKPAAKPRGRPKAKAKTAK
ncbi:MucR family transcriptional regulator [Erythrobacter aureus]|uniref:MucR family transcriptional regulator n=1 Tax=Erythrobacter aureus TaxID=2182384 RepID=UPI003A9014F1